MKVAIIGATGFIGRHLCETCIGRGDSVTALVRNIDAGEALAKRGVSVVPGDVMDAEAVCRTCSGADVVFNLAGALGRWNTPTEELARVNNWAAGHLVRCAAKSGAGRVVHTSTAGVSGPLPTDVCASEDYEPMPVTDYQRTKLAGERAALEAHRAMGIPLVIVRPAFVYGPGDKHKLSLFHAVAACRMALVNGGMSRLHPVFVDDLVFGMICACERAPGFGEVYILAGASPVTTRKLLEVIAWALAVPAPRISLPEGLLLPLAFFAEMVGRTARVEPPLTRARVRLFSEHYAYSIERARSKLGFKPVMDLAEGIKRTVDWYRSHGLLRSKGREGERAG